MDDFVKGIAFVFEGYTEKYFYLSLMEHLSAKYRCQLKQDPIEDYCILKCPHSKKIVKTIVVGTNTQVPNSGHWFKNVCFKNHDKIPWIVFLCYDADDYLSNITKFHEGDWKDLRENYLCDAQNVVDLTAHADIEDIMLADFEGVCNYIKIDSSSVPHGRKGKSKMKYLFRLGKQHYHEGKRAKPLISSLNKDIIMQKAKNKEMRFFINILQT